MASPTPRTLSPTQIQITTTSNQRVEVNTGARTMATQSMRRYRRDLSTPRFEWIAPKNMDG
eukprot:5475279-Lingulodinium_polyedra.AAC.1